MSANRARAARTIGAVIAMLALAAVGLATPAAGAPPPDPGSGEIPGVDEIVSSKNMRQIAHVPKQPPFTGEGSFATDIAFQGDLAYVGNYDGFVIYDIKNPRRPQIVAQVLCPGGQNDVSVAGDLLFLSTDSRRTDNTCTSAPSEDPVNYWEGIKVFDVSDPASPHYVTAVETDCGSHTHTLVPGDKDTVYLYVSSYSPSPQLAGCRPPHDKISVVEVPLSDPASTRVVAEPVLFPEGGNPGSGTDQGISTTTGCHDITVYPSKDIAAGACMGDGILMDISDPVAPRVIERVQDDVNFAFWHSATFNSDATKVVFTDELGGGLGATCNAAVGPTRGADGIYDIVGSGKDLRLEFRSYFKIPREQADTENCVAHNGSLIPVKGRDIMVQAWYQGGVSVWDFTDSANPEEIGYWERGPLSNEELVVGGSWSAYWYNGYIYSSDIQKGLDVLEIRDPRVAGAERVQLDVLNVQTQPSYRG
jgi:hypothetical protein